ncbi:MAG: hypothetical protein IID12_02865 [Candidatus Marinimicrobia bacterium]|nr:hypothetical protein [Candidatus Neomarinimicrobiota bacterium]
MVNDLLRFIPLAVLSNTVFPLTFDPILLFYAAPYPLGTAWIFAVLGSISAAFGGIIDIKLLRSLSNRVPITTKFVIPDVTHFRFYIWIVLFALSPIPFTFIRVAMLWSKPDPVLYGLSVGIGRLPRYLLTIYLWQSLTLPVWVSGALLPSALVLGLWQYWFRKRSSGTSSKALSETVK